MAKVRVVMVNLEGADETVDRAVAGVLAIALRAGDPASAPAEAAPMVAAREEMPRLLPTAPAKRRRGRAKACPAPEAKARRASPEGAALPASVIEGVLRKRPMTSGEVIRAIHGAKPADLYFRLGQMRKQGTVETREDPADGDRKNFLVASA